MPRTGANPATADATNNPWVAKWTSASEDVTSSTALAAPLLIPGLSGEIYFNPTIAGDSASKTFSWQLLLMDNKVLTLGAPSVVRGITFTTAATARRVDAVGSSGLYLHEDKIIDIGGLGSTPGESDRFWVLALSGIDTDSGAYLLRYGNSRNS